MILLWCSVTVFYPWYDKYDTNGSLSASPPLSQVVGGRITESGRLGAFITKVKKGSLADVVGHLRAGMQSSSQVIFYILHLELFHIRNTNLTVFYGGFM